MASSAEPAGSLFDPLPEGFRSLLLGIGIAAGSIALFHLSSSFSERAAAWSQGWSAWVLSALLGFIRAAVRQGHRAFAEEWAGLAELLPAGQNRPPAPVLGYAPIQIAAALIGACLGILVIPAFQGDGGFLFRAENWDAVLLWSLVVNMTLFGSLGLNAAQEVLADRRVHRELTPRVEVDLLDLEPLRVYAKRGRRMGAIWLFGSSLAALLFVSWPFSGIHAGILAVTLATGALSVIRPMRGIHRRIEREKQSELLRTRGEIHRTHHAFDAATGPAREAAVHLPALLAWETRIERVHTWPVDPSTALRLGLLGAVAVGSWVGGAVIERILESWLA